MKKRVLQNSSKIIDLKNLGENNWFKGDLKQNLSEFFLLNLCENIWLVKSKQKIFLLIEFERKKLIDRIWAEKDLI